MEPLRVALATTISERAAAGGRTEQQAPSAFIDLGALESGHGRCEIRLDLGGGVVLEVVRR